MAVGRNGLEHFAQSIIYKKTFRIARGFAENMKINSKAHA